MASSSSRSRAATRRSPRAAPRQRIPPTAPAGRPGLAPFVAVFGVLVAAEYLWLAWLLRDPEVSTDWFVAVPAVLAVLALAGAALVVLGRARAWVLLATVSVVLVLCLLGTALLFGALGLGAVAGLALLLLVGPIGCLVLAVRRPVREWTRPARATRPRQQGRRTQRTR
jgi:O-antigen/teichoic acid export membrane protein